MSTQIKSVVRPSEHKSEQARNITVSAPKAQSTMTLRTGVRSGDCYNECMGSCMRSGTFKKCDTYCKSVC